MYNTKQLIREELSLNDRKCLLSEQSILLIKDNHYVNHVLGIKTPLNEYYSLSLRKQIIEEQILMETVIDSINKFIGGAIEKGKEKVVTVVNAIHNIKDIAILFKDLILSSEFMVKATKTMTKTCNDIATRLKTKLKTIITTIGKIGSEYLNKFNELINNGIDLLTKLSTGTGWKGFLTMLGFSILMILVETKIVDWMISNGEKALKVLANLVDGIGKLFISFNEFSTIIISQLNIEPILTWFTNSAVESGLGMFFIGINIINIISEILAPVIKSIDWAKKLSK
jgi:hypothetical protein